ncbi:MAG: gliding motility-associated C-terminal domain-containing protein [Bacteroidales bacterium]|nr:gliding motility-associated C-terminal domain-containing protein [Bacteroidales bacterium]
MKKIILLSILLFIGNFIIAQDGTRQYIQNINGQTINLAQGMEIISSGVNATTNPNHPLWYGTNEHYTVTLRCTKTAKKLKFSFRTINQMPAIAPSGSPQEHVDIKSTDHLKIYDGATTASPLLYDYTNISYNRTIPYLVLPVFVTTQEYLTVEWTSDAASATGYGFRVAVGCPPDSCGGKNKPAGDSCQNATPICDITNYCGNTSYWYSRDLPGNLCDVNLNAPGLNCPLFPGAIDNNSWLIFQAALTTVSLQVTISNCVGSSLSPGVQLAVYETSNCNNFVLHTTTAYVTEPALVPGVYTINITGLTIGSNYYVMIDGKAGAVCDYTIRAINGFLIIDAGTPKTICTGASTTLCATGGSNYTWSTGQTGTCITVTPTSTQWYKLTGVPGFSLCGFTATDSVLVSLYPVPAITANSPSLCIGQCKTITASGGVTYTWSTGQNGATISVCPTANTTYYVTSTDSNGCTGTTSAVVTVNQLPVISATGGTICRGACIIITATGGDTYTWSNSLNGTSISVCPTVTTTYYVTGTNSLGCTNTSSTVVIVNPQITIGTTGNTACSGTCTTVTATGADYYTWNTGQTGPTISVCPTVSTTYYVTGANTFGCTGTNSAVVTINASPNLTATGGQVCGGTCTTISASGANTYTWSTGQNGNTISVCPTINTTYNVTGTNTSGCTNSTSAVVTMYTNPTITANGGAICTGKSIVINASGGISYTWSPGGQLTPSITVSPVSNTQYCVTGKDTHGCTNSACVSVAVNPNPTIVASINPHFICNGESATLTASGGNTYIWVPGNFTGNLIIVTPNVNTTYTVTGTDGNGCTNIDTAVVLVNPPISAGVSGINEICGNGKGKVCTSPSGGTPGYTYVWNVAGSLLCLDNVQSGTYYVTITDSKGCKVVRSVSITNQMTNPDGTPTADKYFDIITHKFIFDWTGVFGYKYHWDFGDGDTSNLKNPAHTFKKSGTYTIKLIVTSLEGCITEYTLVIEVVIPFKIEVFNVFTPDNDGFNDKYRVKYEGDYSYFRMMIFNRWGRKLYETNDIDAGWECNNCSDGTYYYIINAKGKDGGEYDFHGFLTLIK